MHIITGGTGHVGSATAEALLRKKEKVTIVSRNADKAREWEEKGAQVAVADVEDTARLHEIFRQGKTVFLLNPPADPATDTDRQEKKTVSLLLEALKGSGVERVVAGSVMGSRSGEHIGDLGTLYQLEKGVEGLPCSYSIIRPAYYMSNWDAALQTARDKGEIISFYPMDMKIPMVAPKDIGELAARLLTQADGPAINAIEGPERYSASDVAAAFAAALGKEVKVKVVPREEWQSTFKAMGFSDAAALSYANMTDISVRADYEVPDKLEKGGTTLQRYVEELVGRSAK